MISLEFHLTSPFSGEIGFSGVPLRAAFLNLLQEYDEELSGDVHGSKGPRTYSLDPFPCDRQFKTHFEHGKEYDFKVYLFTPSKFQNLIRNVALTTNHDLRLHHHYFPLRRVDFKKHSLSNMMDEWSSMVDKLEQGPLRIRIQFMTPTQLSHFGSNRAYLLPDPDKVFSGLLRLWNSTENTIQLEHIGEYRDWVSENVYISSHDIETVVVSLGRKRSFIGFVGSVIYNIESCSDPLTKFTLGLANYAEICNIGKSRSAGFGKVRVELLNTSSTS